MTHSLKELVAQLGPVSQEVAMTIAEQFRQEVRQGRNREIAGKLLAKGLSVTEVAELTGLSIDEVYALVHASGPGHDHIH